MVSSKMSVYFFYPYTLEVHSMNYYRAGPLPPSTAKPSKAKVHLFMHYLILKRENQPKHAYCLAAIQGQQRLDTMYCNSFITQETIYIMRILHFLALYSSVVYLYLTLYQG